MKRLEEMKLLEANSAKVIEATKSRPCLNPKSRPNRRYLIRDVLVRYAKGADDDSR